jgi:hypothetical protein
VIIAAAAAAAAAAAEGGRPPPRCRWKDPSSMTISVLEQQENELQVSAAAGMKRNCSSCCTSVTV